MHKQLIMLKKKLNSHLKVKPFIYENIPVADLKIKLSI